MNGQKIKKMIPLVAIGVFAGSLIYSLIQFGFSPRRDRRVFYFNSYDKSSRIVEVRYLADKPVQGEICCFIDDLLLGPLTNRSRRIFPRGTSVEFCLEKGRDLHVGLSREALSYSGETFDVESNISLFRYNIVKNFTNLDKIYLYIDGHEVP
ncbi:MULTISPECIES: GerMN domain-containing protein [Treponema]|jgi:hypothetical protein|uniref:GerMN domain-containing protein n=1 Tax=Treponema rectale TaxID=744512 RepID=A0A840SFB4_9SPIR|nr:MULTISPECIES: GerMN domain-containing protein [Treponema]MBB5218131.1 hypothetical protein [Treponema rectale]MBE6354625.1 hypothetical protein [Treponema sp.]QOS40159.1 hypothetical protein DYE49_06710 [Treponema rectale]